MRCTPILALAVVGCTYHEPHVGGDGGSGSGNPPPRTCPIGDPSLRLCVQFDGALSPTVADGMMHTIQATAVTAMFRDSEPAAHVDGSSILYIAPADASTLDVTQLTIEMWISPDMRPGPAGYWMLDNNNQYGIEYRDDGQIRCVIHDKTVDSVMSIATGGWRHVACTYNQSHLAVLIDGAVDNCFSLSEAIHTDGMDGVAIGANLGAGPMFNDRFVGGLDNVRVYDRTLPASELCTIAGNGTGCKSTCPDGGESDD